MTTTITQSQDLMSSPVLNVRGLRKTYGGVVALKGVDFDLMPGEIHGLCGENGAGKSTLVKILGGLVAPTEGEITVDGAAFKGRTDPRLISIVHQSYRSFRTSRCSTTFSSATNLSASSFSGAVTALPFVVSLTTSGSPTSISISQLASLVSLSNS
ncbi:ATP-binding cassette domain-containing protein [Rhizobium ruizarguesonis]|uniref:ATP-binding cassette domain-containing protein n=1 Tax=Rhizobium ruizarguesonis TaxID=2081791 RepID=UPI001FE23090|nr:ATP-binding cassette domain-containing protein [Rhizobium ruizarguesonis]